MCSFIHDRFAFIFYITSSLDFTASWIFCRVSLWIHDTESEQRLPLIPLLRFTKSQSFLIQYDKWPPSNLFYYSVGKKENHPVTPYVLNNKDCHYSPQLQHATPYNYNIIYLVLRLKTAIYTGLAKLCNKKVPFSF